MVAAAAAPAAAPGHTCEARSRLYTREGADTCRQVGNTTRGGGGGGGGGGVYKKFRGGGAPIGWTAVVDECRQRKPQTGLTPAGDLEHALVHALHDSTICNPRNPSVAEAIILMGHNPAAHTLPAKLPTAAGCSFEVNCSVILRSHKTKNTKTTEHDVKD
jgi:hypothetical protein